MDLIDRLMLDYDEYRQKRHFAIGHCDTERVAILDKRMRRTREELDIAMEAQQRGEDLKDHELSLWAKAGYPPVIEHEKPLTMFGKRPSRVVQTDEYIVPQKPTAADWRRAALRYVETGKKEHYKLMLTLVSLDHPVP